MQQRHTPAHRPRGVLLLALVALNLAPGGSAATAPRLVSFLRHEKDRAQVALREFAPPVVPADPPTILGLPAYWCHLLPGSVILVGIAVVLYRKLTAGEAEDRVSAHSLTEVAAALALYLTTAPAIILLNKEIMTADGFPYPVLVGNMGVLGTFFFSQAMVQSGAWRLEAEMNWWTFCRLILPLSLFGCLALATGNMVYLYLPVPLVQILKVGTLMLTLVFGAVAGLEKMNVLPSILLICVGSVVASSSRFVGASASWLLLVGLLINTAANVGEAARMVTTQLCVVKLRFQDSIFWASPVMLVVNSLVILFLEAPGLSKITLDRWLALKLLASMCLGCAVNLSGWWLTKLVGALAMKVLSNARNYLVIVAAITFRPESFHVLESIGFSTALVGVFLFELQRAVPKPCAKAGEPVICASGKDVG